MKGTLANILTVARSHLGYVEGPGSNQNKFASVAGHQNGYPWCASFVAAVCKVAGVEIPNTSAYTPTMSNGFKGVDRWHYTGKPGDIVFFKWPGMGRIAHVGIVESVGTDREGTYYICIEGNTDSAGGRSGGRVMRQRRRANIAGFGRPVYKTGTAPRPDRVLKPGMQGVDVKNVQNALNAFHSKMGYGLLPLTGRYNAITLVCVKRFQKAMKLTDDGVVGPKTWAALRKAIHG